jgi:hypothetical protein
MANVVLIGYVIMAMREDQGDVDAIRRRERQQSKATDGKKAQWFFSLLGFVFIPSSFSRLSEVEHSGRPWGDCPRWLVSSRIGATWKCILDFEDGKFDD